MEWYYWLSIALSILGAVWGGWRLIKRLPHEAAEALVALGDMIADDKIERDEIVRLVTECTDVAELVGRLSAMVTTQIQQPPAGFFGWLQSLLGFSQQTAYPPAPHLVDLVAASELDEILAGYGIDITGTRDRIYALTTKEEYERFLRWYRDTHRYTEDAYDCDDFAWVMRAEALKWSHGEVPFGYIEAAGMDTKYKFPNHGFCFVVDNQLQVYFCDELEIAAPKNELWPAYPVQQHCEPKV